MLINFIIHNYKSINEPLYIDFTNKEQRIKNEEKNLFKKVNGEQVSRINFFYGKNGSGKSKIIEAIKDLKDIALGFRAINPTYLYNERGMRPINKKRISSFFLTEQYNPNSFLSATFSIDNYIYRYSIVIDTRNEKIIEEKLESLTNDNIILFSTKDFEYDYLTKVEEERLRTYKQETRTTLSILKNEFNITNLEFASHINNVYQFFYELKFSFENVEQAKVLKQLYNDEELLLELSEQIKKFDIGIEGIEIKDLNAFIFNNEELRDHLFLEETINEDYEIRIIYKGKSLNFDTQSSGTKKIFSILFSIYNTKRGVYVIDDFEKDIHNEVAIDLVKFLANNKTNLQFIFTTHELEFLNLPEVHNKALHYFVEKNHQTLSTEVIYLSQFSDLRNDDRNSWELFYKKHRLGQYPDILYSRKSD